MLVLTRRDNESIIIGDRLITITLLGKQSGQIRIGIDAPKDLAVHREEIFDQIKAGIKPKQK